jgi:polysaccharide biosynthesis transport protein
MAGYGPADFIGFADSPFAPPLRTGQGRNMFSPRTALRAPAGSSASATLPQQAANWLRPPSSPTVLTLKPGLIEFLKAVRHRWLPASAAALVVALVAGLATWIVIPPLALRYQATGLLTLDSKAPVLLTAESYNGNDFPSYRRTQIDLLKSRAILVPALQKPLVAEYLGTHDQDPEQVIRNLAANLKIEFGVPEWPSEVLRVTLQGEDAEQTVLLVNAIQETFLEKTIENSKQRQASRVASLKQSYQESLKELEAKRSRFLAAAEETGPVSLEDEQIAAMQLTDYQRELSRLELAKMKAQTRGKMHTVMKPPAVTPEMLDNWVEKDREVRELRKRVDAINDELQKIRSIAVQPESLEEYRELLGLMRVAQDALHRRQNEMRPKIEQRLLQIAHNSVVDDEDDGPDEQLLSRQAELLAQRTSAQAQKVRALADKRRRFELVQSEHLQSAKASVDGLDASIRALKEKIDFLELEKNAPPRVHGIGDVAAEPINENDSLKRMRNAGFAALLAAAFTIVGFGWWEFQSQRVHASGDIASRLGIRLVGTLPSLNTWRLPAPKVQRVASDLAARDRMQDSVDSVATLLTHEMDATGARVLLVTSALEHEGKTTLAADLAASFARNGRKTLLIDSDLVRPSLHQRFGVSLTPGLSEALWKQTAPDVGIHNLTVPNLSLLTAGRSDPQVMLALGRDAMEPLLKHYRDTFELIVIDSSPVLPLAHAMRISKHVDAAVLAVMNNQSVIPAVAAANQRLLALEVPVLGAIFIGPHVGNATSTYTTRSWKLMRA